MFEAINQLIKNAEDTLFDADAVLTDAERNARADFIKTIQEYAIIFENVDPETVRQGQ